MSQQHFSYSAVPSAKQFQKDSSITFAVRSDDQILTHLDWLLERYEHYNSKNDYGLRRIVLCEIFLSANYWVKSYHEGRPRMKKERYPAVLALFESSVNTLSDLLQVTPSQVAQHIREMFGRELTEEGARTDANMHAKTFSKQEKAMHRIRFKGGLAYHYGLEPKPGQPLLALDTPQFFIKIRRKNPNDVAAETFPGWGPFVMTMEREFYMTKHWLNSPGHENIFHSSYTGGGIVSAAGTMEVKKGIITGMRPDSGHYRPLNQNFAAALLALQMFGVRMDQLVVYHWNGTPLGNAKEFMKSNMSWDEFQKSRADYQLKHPQQPPVIAPDNARIPAPNVGGNSPAASGASGAYN